MLERFIAHCDCNSFFASVELLHYPNLLHLPVAVSGSVDDRHGIILAKNEPAKAFGVQTAETVWQARRKCPNLVLLPPHHQEYRKYYKIINEIYAMYTDRVEPFGIDESWLDLTGSWQLFAPSPLLLANIIRERVHKETGLTISVGLSFNKVFAKMGSDYKKPNATTEITKANYRDIIWPLPASAMLYVGRRTAETLAEVGIKTIADLAAANPELLSQVLGKQGGQMWHNARGEDNSPVAYTGEQEPVKSVGNGITFRRNLLGMKDLRTALGGLADEVAGRLRNVNLYATTLQIVIKNPELKSISRQKQLPFATNLAKDLADAAMQLVNANWDLAKPVRMLTLTATGLTDMPFAVQTSLYGETTQISKRRQSLEESMDTIRKKYGQSAILQAGLLHNDIGMQSNATPNEDSTEEALTPLESEHFTHD